MTINSTTRKTNNLAGNGNTHTYPFAFKVFADSEIVVKKLEVSTSIETTLQLGANNDYIVTLNQDQNGNPGGSITLKSGGNNYNLPSGFQIVITSAVQSLQGTDLTNQGGFYPEVINDALDKSAILHQQQQNELDRSIKFALTNTIGSLEVTESATARANKVMAFDAAGELTLLNEIGTYRGNWAASTAYVVRDLVKDTNTNNVFMCNAAHTSSGAQPLTTNTDSAKWDLIVDSATAATSSTNAASSATAAATSATAAANSATAAATSATSAASSASTATTKATQADTAKTAAETAKTAAETAKTAAETALDSFDDRYLGAKSSNPTLDNDGNALIDGALYFNTTVNRMRVYDLDNTTWLEVTIVGSDLTNTNTVAGSINNVNTVAGSISGVNAVANNATNINAVNSNATNINTVASTASNINAVASNASNVNTVASNISNVNAIATDIAKIQTVANDLNETVSEIETAANDLNETTSEIDTVANAITNVDNVGNNIANVNTVAGIASNVTSVAGNATNVNTVAGAITNVNNVGGSIANVNTCATNLSGINSFAERYRTDNTGNNPSTSLNAGDLFFNQGSGKLLVYNGNTSAWEETQSVGNFFINTIGSYSGTGGNSATFNNSAYKFTLSNAGQFAQQMLVSINGVVQKPNSGTGQPSEGFALDGANIVFSSAPPSGADYFIVTIGASVSIGTPSNNTVTSAHIVNGAIVNEDINASAAIAGSKISPTFTSSLQVTSGNITASDGGVIINGSGGAILYLNDSDDNPDYQLRNIGGTFSIHDGTNTANRFVVNTDGHVDIAGNLDVGAGLDVTGAITTTGGITLNNSGPRITFTDSNENPDFYIEVNATQFLIQDATNNAQRLRIQSNGVVDIDGNTNFGAGIDVVGNITVTGTVDGVDIAALNTTVGNLSTDIVSDTSPQLGGDLQSNGNDIDFADGDKAVFGADSDLIIKHDNANWIESMGTNTLNFTVNNGSEYAAQMFANGAVELRHDNVKKFETASHGITVQGEVRITGSAGAGTTHFNYLGNGNNYITKADSGITYFRNASGTTLIQHLGDGTFAPGANNTYDLGNSSNRWRNIYTNDLNLSNEGGANDVDGTWGSYTIQEGAEDLFLVNKRNGKKYKFNLTEVS